jgi:hydroxypyruvate reductase
MVSDLVTDAKAISQQWLAELDLRRLITERLTNARMLDADFGVDVVAIGKAAREMSDVTDLALGTRVLRALVICDRESAEREPRAGPVVVGDHPVPGVGSLNAGRSLRAFLDIASGARCTLFLISGGASSLCALPEPPLDLVDLALVWDAALASGVDITTLNKVRAATSQIAGGRILRCVRTEESRSLIMVDNVLSGAEWVASGLTYDFSPDAGEAAKLVAKLNLGDVGLRDRLLRAASRRSVAMAAPIATVHENAVVAEPAMLMEHARGEARRRGYRVVEMGSDVHGDVRAVCDRWMEVIRSASDRREPLCVLGVGEVTVQVRGSGSGGRCQEFAWSMADPLANLGRMSAFVARASDGRDFLAGVSGAWVDESTKERAERVGIDWEQILRDHDSHRALEAVGQLLVGGHTGWNLCDVYVALVEGNSGAD